MEKIILTWEQHEAIEELKKSGWTTHRVFDQHAAGWNNRKTAFLNNYNLDEVNNLFFEKGSYVVEKPELKFEPADIPMSIEEYNRQEELKAKYRQEERMMSLQDTMQEGINAIKQLVSVLGEKVHKNIQANVNFKPKINYNPETLDIDDFVKEVKKQIDKGFFHVGEEPPVPYTEKEQEHLNNPFYKKVDEITEKVKMQQILKGAEKYPEPFNPASWTGEQLVNHGLQEARDLQVYLVGLGQHIERIEKEKYQFLAQLETEAKKVFELRLIVNSWIEKFTEEEKKQYALKEENESLKDENRKLTEIIDLHELNGKDSVDVIERLEEESNSLKEELEKAKKSKDKWKANYFELETKYFGVKYPK